MKDNTLVRIIAIVSIYFLLRYYGGSFGILLLQPINLFVAYLHELGHAFFGIITGGRVLELTVSRDGSGLTSVSGGIEALIIMGGYIGSALFGNVLFYIGVKKPDWSRHTMVILAIIMLLSNMVWFSTIQSFIILLIFSIFLFILAVKTQWSAVIVMSLGLLSTIYIIQDSQVGPGSDLMNFEQVVGFFTAKAWGYIWLVVVLIIFAFNLRLLVYNKGYLKTIKW